MFLAERADEVVLLPGKAIDKPWISRRCNSMNYSINLLSLKALFYI